MLFHESHHTTSPDQGSPFQGIRTHRSNPGAKHLANFRTDQRVTARADIVANALREKRYWTGFLDTRGWDPRDPNMRTFLGWGVPQPNQTAALSQVEQALTGDLVTLVGDGLVNQSDQRARVNKVDILDGGTTVGSYSWWIGDEGIKASLNIPEAGPSKPLE